VKSHERGKDREVFTTSGAYPWSFVTQIFHNGQPSHGGDRNIITEILMKVALNTITLYIVRHIELQRLKLLLEIIYTFCCKRNTK
jgi:hypothetical protein